MSKSISFLLLSAVVLSSHAGCGGGPEVPTLGTVSGKVSVDGNPLPGVVVTFEPVDGGRSSSGKTDEEGNYSLSYNATSKGALIGKHRVMVTTPTDAPDPSGQNKDPIPEHYNLKTTLEKDVEAGDNSIDLELFM